MISNNNNNNNNNFILDIKHRFTCLQLKPFSNVRMFKNTTYVEDCSHLQKWLHFYLLTFFLTISVSF